MAENNHAEQFPFPRREESPFQRVEKGVHFFLLFVLTVFTVFYLYHAARLILYPYSIDYGEGFLLNQSKEIASGRIPYQPIETPPWLVGNYPPVFPMLAAIGVKIFGIQFHFGRCLSLAGILTAAFCLYRMTEFQTRNRYAALAAGLVWLSSYPVYNWGTHHRVDSLGIGFEALGLLFLLGRSGDRFSILFFLLALFCRQTLWVGPLAGFFYLRRSVSPRAAWRWLGLLFGVGGAVFAVMTLITGGEFFKHIVLYNVNPFHWKDVWRMTQGALMKTMMLPTLFLIYYLLRCIGSGKWDLLGCSIPFSILTFLLVGKLGSATNYLFEIAFVSSWAVGMTLAEAKVHLPKGNPLRIIPALFLAFGVFFPLHIPHLYGQWEIYDWGGTPVSDSHKQTQHLSERISEIPPPALCQDAGLALLSGHELVWQPFILTQLSNQGIWDPEPLLKSIRERKYNAVVLPINLELDPDAWTRELWWSQFTKEFADAVRANYRVAPRISPRSAPGVDSRWVWGYHSTFGTNYLYLPRE